MENTNQLFVTKASGDTAPFSEMKLRRSMKKAGASRKHIDEIIEKVMNSLYPGITTKEIYGIAFRILRENARHVAARYNLKKGLMELGPSGFPFEKFVAEILMYQGYKVKTGEIVKGKCVNHEIDIIANKNDQHFMIECKYHNLPGTLCNVKIPLYVQARFKDVEFTWKALPGHRTKFHQGWLVTNTNFTRDAIQYGICAGLSLLGWNFPEENNLRTKIDTLGLYPVTCLTSLTKSEKQILLAKRIVLCQEIAKDEHVLLNAGIKANRTRLIMDEAFQLSHSLRNKRNL